MVVMTLTSALNRKRRLEQWIPVDCLLHRETIQFVREHDAPDRVKRARSQIVDEQGINIGPSDSRVPNHGLNAPVKRVKFAEGSPHAQLIFSVANAVLYQQEIYSKDNIAIFNEPGKCVAHINIAIGRTPICRCNAGDEFDGFYLTENMVPVSARVALKVWGR